MNIMYHDEDGDMHTIHHAEKIEIYEERGETYTINLHPVSPYKGLIRNKSILKVSVEAGDGLHPDAFPLQCNCELCQSKRKTE